MTIRQVKTLTIFSGKDAFPIDLTAYAFVQAREYEDRVRIDFFNHDSKIEKQIFNPSAEISYE